MEATLKAQPILITLLAVSRKYKSDYCFPSQEKIMELMGKFEKVGISRATLNRWLRVIEDRKFIIRKRRIKRNGYGGIIFNTTMYKIKIKGLRLLAIFGVDVSKEIDEFEKWEASIKPRREKKQKEKMMAPENNNNNRKVNQSSPFPLNNHVKKGSQ